MEGKKEVKVAASFPADFFQGLARPSMVMRPGDELKVENETSKAWPAFVLVTNKKGERGWVPERYLRRSETSAVASKEYDTKTLNPSIGEVLTVIEEDIESGWVWCRDKKGNLGWFASDHLEE